MEPREILEEFRLEKILKTSPWSTVFRAIDPASGDPVVLKVISCGGPVVGDREVERFHQVLSAVKNLPGTSLPPILDFGITPDASAFLVMDSVDGVELSSVPSVDPSRAITLALQIVGSVEILQSAGAAHLNLRTDNVLISDTEPTEKVYLLGFGTAPYLAAVAPGVWPGKESDEIASELRRGVALKIEEGWRSDLYSVAMITTKLLDGSVDGAGGGRPSVMLGLNAVEQLAEASVLVSALEQALVGDPRARGESLAGIRDALIRAMPAEPVRPAAPRLKEYLAQSEAAMHETIRVPREATPEPKVEPAPPPPSNPTVDSMMEELMSSMPTLAHSGSDASSAASGKPSPASSPRVTEQAAAPPPPPPEPRVPPKVADIPPPARREPPKRQTSVRPAVEPVPGDLSRQSAGPKFSLPKVAVIGGLFVMAAAAIITVFVMVSGTEEVVPVEAEVVRPAPPTAVPTPVEEELVRRVDQRLLTAQLQLIDGDIEGARASVESLTPEEVAGFSEEETAVFEEIRESLAGTDREKAIRDLREGLETGSIRMLRRGVAGVASLSGEEIAAEPGLARDLRRARDALRTHGELWEASRAGAHMRVLERAATLEKLMPRYEGGDQIREQAAIAIIAEAETSISQGDFQAAIGRLEALNRVWPERAGITERIAWCRNQLAAARRMQTAINEALAKGDAGDPEGGVRRLDAVDIAPGWEDRVASARDRLEVQLRNLDAGYPIVEVGGNFELAFRKNQSIVVPLKVSDDYRVERVVVLVRTATDSSFREIPLERSGEDTYTFELTPELHGNAAVRFYVVATDRSGHETRLGGPDGPLTIVRKKWFQK